MTTNSLSQRERLSQALVLLPHAGLEGPRYEWAARTLRLALSLHGGPCAVAVLIDFDEANIRASLHELLADAPLDVPARRVA